MLVFSLCIELLMISSGFEVFLYEVFYKVFLYVKVC